MQRLAFIVTAGFALACSKQPETPTTTPPGGTTTPTSEPTTEPEAKDPRTQVTEACNGGDAAECTAVGVMWLEGQGGDADPAKAREFFDKSCTGGHDAGCSHLARMLDKGEGGAADAAKARELWIAQCDKGNNAGGECYSAGRSYEAGGSPEDLAAARKIYTKLCVAGEVAGCVGEARVVMRGTNKGDQKHARSVLQGACDGGDAGGCFELAAAMDAGKGGKKDAKGAAAMRKKACDAGYKEACG